MLLSLALVMTLAAEPSVAVLVGRRTAVAQAEAQALAQSVSMELTAAKVLLTLDAGAASARLGRLGLKDSSFCGGKKACLVELGKQLAVEHVLVVSASQVGSDRSVALELWKVADGSVEEREGLLVPPGSSVPADLLAPFTAKLRARFPVAAPSPPPEPVKPPDAPVVTKPPEPVALTPAPAPVVVAPATPPPPPSHVTGLVLGGAGVVALAAGIVLVASGLAARGEATRTELVDGTLRSPLTASEAQAKADAANLNLGLAGGAGALALGLGAAAVLTW